MGQVIVLGTSNVIPEESRDNTHLLVKSGKRVILIDVTANTLRRMVKGGIPVEGLTDIIVTHFHPDHVAGLPLLMMCLWLSGRREPLTIFGLKHTISRIKKMVGLFDLQELPGFFPMHFITIPAREGAVILSDEDIRVEGTPVHHFIPTLGIKLTFNRENKTLVYSSDTEPCDRVVRLAKDSDVLIHEATGAFSGHSSAAQAGRIAARAGVKRLFLIHYPDDVTMGENLIQEARETFGQAVQLARDLMTIEL